VRNFRQKTKTKQKQLFTPKTKQNKTRNLYGAKNKTKQIFKSAYKKIVTENEFLPYKISYVRPGV